MVSELNVKELVVSDGTASFMRAELGLDFKAAGPVLRKDVGKVKGLLQGLDAGSAATAAAEHAAGGEVSIPGWPDALPASIFVRNEVAGEGVEVAADGGLTVALDTDLDEALIREGLVRDLVRQIQLLRKETGLDVSDRIRLGLSTESAELSAGVAEHGESLADEVLATELIDGAIADADGDDSWEIQGHAIRVWLARA